MDPGDAGTAAGRRYGVGYALAPKKQHSFIQQSLVASAASRGIDLIRIDPAVPLLHQGPFHCIIHKLSGDPWRDQLRQYAALHPAVAIVDPPDAIERLHNRISMLQVVSDLAELAGGEAGGGETFGVPKQIVVYSAADLADPAALAGLKLPVIAKPLVADGSAKSHKMALLFNRDGLLKLKPPIVLQEFVNHGGVIFKVYVVGDHVRCVKRKSLPDVSEEKLGSSQGSVSFSQVSNIPDHDNDSYYEAVQIQEAAMPPASFVTEIARGLRRAVGLHLFNFDVIRDSQVGNRYLVIDINYFPGYAKMPDYEAVLTDFFWEIVHKDDKNGSLGGDEG